MEYPDSRVRSMNVPGSYVSSVCCLERMQGELLQEGIDGQDDWLGPQFIYNKNGFWSLFKLSPPMNPHQLGECDQGKV